MPRARALLVVALVTALSALGLTVAATALAATGTPNSATNLSPNPILASNATGYTIQQGATGLSRVSVTDHVAASWAAKVTSTGTVTRLDEPNVAVTAGTTYTFASDVKASRAGATAQVTTSWYTSGGAFLSYGGGGSTTLSATNWTRVSASLTAPANAGIGQTVVNVSGTANTSTVQVTQHDVEPPVAANQPPVAAFTSTTSGLTASVDGSTSRDPDGSIAGYSWNWGDGSALGTGVTASHGYAAAGTKTVTLTVTDNKGATNTVSHPVTVATTVTLTNRPAQPAGVFYDDNPANLGGVEAYAHPGALVVAGRVSYGAQQFKDVSAAGGTVLIYLDTLLNNAYGRYHDMLINASPCGAAVPLWPGNYTASQWGQLNDFRVGGVLQNKLHCVLEAMVAENPHMGGFFADDLGSRSWYPGFDWNTFPDQAGWRAGAIALSQTFRQVADEHHLIVIVNGTWEADSGGGYPNAAVHGNALADGGFVEEHDGQIGYFGPYGCGSQWATQSAVTHGVPFMFATVDTQAGLTEYANSNCYAYVNFASSAGPAPWGSFHPTGLPSKAS